MELSLRFRRLNSEDSDLPLPRYMSEGAAGMDVVAALQEPLTLGPGERGLVPTGWAVEIPAGFEVQVRPRSGLAFTHGVTVLNAPGTIDSDYRGEVGILLVNHGSEPFQVVRGERVAQLVVGRVYQPAVVEAAQLGETKRGRGGFGSTGL